MSNRALSDKERQANILVVDDQALTRTMVKTALKGVGFDNIHLSENGDQAMQFLQHESVDLIIADWLMPGISGLDLLRYVRKAETEFEKPFIMLTGQCTRESVVEAASARVSGYIGKPFSPDELVNKVLQLLRKPPTSAVKGEA